MKSSSGWYKGCAVLLAFAALAHTAGLLRASGGRTRGTAMDAALRSMRAAHFEGMGASRSLWDFYLGFNLMLSVWLLFVSVLAWQLATLPSSALAAARGVQWSLCACLAAVAVLGF